MVEMQTYIISGIGIDVSAAVLFPFTTKANHLLLGGRRCGRRSRRSAPPPVAAAAADHSQDHYAVLGLSSRASSTDIKRAYRLLALKYHPDVSKDLQADKVFKSIRIAYEVLSNEKARAQYDDALRFQEDISQPWGTSRTEDSEFDEGLRIYRWDKLRQRMRKKWQYDATDENSSYNEADAYEEDSINERGSFSEVLRFAFCALFFMQTLGSQASLTLCGLSALLDKQLDGGYKMGYVVAWALGGRSGILLTLCLSFASWLCGKSSSSLVVLVVIAMWVGANVARFVPIPRGALLTLLYMSMKLQVGLR